MLRADNEHLEVISHPLVQRFQAPLYTEHNGSTVRKSQRLLFGNHRTPPNEVYHIQDFHVQKGNPESPRHLEDSQQGGRRIPAGHRSQSEADWAYARRALARGDAPEEVIRRIADYRAEDKADPGYYARLTVTKAQRTLMSPERDITPRQDFFHLSDRDH